MKILHKGTVSREFTKIPNRIFTCGLSTDAIALYSLLAFHRSGFSQSQAQLRDTLGITRERCTKAIQQLADKGLVELGERDVCNAFSSITVVLDDVTTKQQIAPSPVYNTTPEQTPPSTHQPAPQTPPSTPQTASSSLDSLDNLLTKFGI